MFGGVKQMAALFTVRINSWNLRLYVCFGELKSSSASFPPIWPGSLQSSPYNLGATLKNPQTNTQNTKTNKKPPQNHPQGVVLISFFLFSVIALFVFAPLGVQQLEFSWLACWHRSTGGLLPQERLLGCFPGLIFIIS